MYNKLKDFSVLYIEDDDELREITSSMLQRIFKDVYTGSDGKKGYELYKKYRPDIVITDIKMPVLNGIELAKKIREDDDKTRIIITTAFSDEAYLLEAVELNLERYIVKPLTNRNLLPALEKAISKIDKKIYFTKDFYYNYRTSLFIQQG